MNNLLTTVKLYICSNPVGLSLAVLYIHLWEGGVRGGPV